MKKIVLDSEKSKTRKIIKSAMTDISLCQSFAKNAVFLP